MDLSITSWFPAGAPAPAGADAPAGSGAELAAIFADLVAGLGVEQTDPSVESRPAEDSPDLVEELAPLEPEDEQDLQPVTAMPWWLASPAETPASTSLGEATSGPQAPATQAVSVGAAEEVAAQPSAMSHLAQQAPSPEGAAVNAPEGQLARPVNLAGEQGRTTPAEVTEPTSTPMGATETASPAPPPQAARALARALAALDPGAAANSDTTPATTAAVAAPVDEQPAEAPARTETSAPISRAAEPGAPRPNLATAAPVPASTIPIMDAKDASAGHSEDGGSGHQQRPADPAPAPTFRALPVSEGTIEALLHAQAPQGLEHRATNAGVVKPAETASVTEQDAAVARQLVQAIRIRAGEGSGEARLRLNPEFLGEVRIDLKVAGDRVSAVLHVEREDVRQQIENGTPALRAALAAHGLDLDEVTVRDDDASRREGPRQERRQPRERKRRGEPADTFELAD